MSMPDLSKLVSDSFARIVASGAVEKAVENQLEKTIEGIINDQLRSHSDFGSALKEKVKAALQVNDDHMHLPSYGDLIQKIITRAVDAQVHGEYAKKLEANIASLLTEAPAEITLDKLIEDFKEYVKDRLCGDHDDRISLHIEESSSVSGGYWLVAMDKSSRKERYSCEIRFQVKPDGEIFGLQVEGADMTKKLFVGLYNFERDLYRMYASGTKLKIEPGTSADDFSTSMRDD